MHQVETLADAKWNALIASNPKEFNTSATQLFVVETSLHSRKWQEKIENFQEIREKALELVPKLGPLFEGSREETTRVMHGSTLEEERKAIEISQAKPNTMEELKTWLGVI